MIEKQNLIEIADLQLKELLRNKSVFIFDWDGTILDSMGQKSKNFTQAFCSIKEGVRDEGLEAQVTELYLRLSGHPRKQIFLQIIAILGLKSGLDSFLRFNDVFERLNKSSLVNASIFPDALDLLQELIKRDYCRVFISSSVPPQELMDLVEATLPASIRAGIASILGSSDEHAKGKEHLQAIMRETGTMQDELLVFGDDPADHKLSAEAGVDCILVDRTGISSWQGIKRVDSLIQIKDGLPN